MALDAVIFDLDGTLIDTNPAHVEAWRQAFAAFGYRVAAERIAVEVGKGGELLVSGGLGPPGRRRSTARGCATSRLRSSSTSPAGNTSASSPRPPTWLRPCAGGASRRP